METENNLPLELLLIIVEHLEQNDIISFSSVSTYYRQILIPICFKKIKVNRSYSKFTVSDLLEESDGKFLNHIRSGVHDLEFFMNINGVRNIFKDLKSLLKVCPNLRRISFLGTRFGFYDLNCSICSFGRGYLSLFHSRTCLTTNYSFGQINELVCVSKAGLIDDYRYGMEKSPRFLLCFPNLKVLSLTGFILHNNFLKTIQLLPKFTTFISKNCGLKNQRRYTKYEFNLQFREKKKKIPEASISYSNDRYVRAFEWQYFDKKHFFEEVFEHITESE